MRLQTLVVVSVFLFSFAQANVCPGQKIGPFQGFPHDGQGFQMAAVTDGDNACMSCGKTYYQYEQNVYPADQWDKVNKRPKNLYKNVGVINGEGYVCSGNADDSPGAKKKEALAKSPPRPDQMAVVH